jgi:hypothetical protein
VTPDVIERRGVLGISLVVAPLVLGACASPARPQAGVVTCPGRFTASARLKVSLRGRTCRRGPSLVAFRRPDALRVEVPGPTGARILAVARAERLVAVFPGDRAVFEGRANAADLGALLGVALEPAEVMDLLVGAPPTQARGYRARWGPEAPRRVEAQLPDGTRLDLTIEEPRLGPDLPERAFLDPPHEGYRPVGAEEARSLWSGGRP